MSQVVVRAVWWVWMAGSCPWSAVAMAPPSPSHSLYEPPTSPILGAEEHLDALVVEFERTFRGKKAPKKLDELLEAIESALPELLAEQGLQDHWWPSVREAAASLSAVQGQPSTRRTSSQRSSSTKSSSNRASATRTTSSPSLCEEIAYRFGHRDLSALPESSRELQSLIQKGKVPQRSDLSVGGQLRSLLHGLPPETELALAAFEQQLDVWDQGDELGQFLERWRNSGPHGDESFYEALDRAAGTAEEIFYFDAILDEYAQTFGGAEGRKWSRQESHDKLHRSFLALRQYRNMVRAMAAAAVLPSTVPFPAGLSDYDSSKVSGQFRLRDDLDVLAAAANGDTRQVVAECREFLLAHPFPENAWEGYPIASDFGTQFQARLREVSSSTRRSSADILAEQRDRSARASKLLAESTLTLLGACLQ